MKKTLKELFRFEWRRVTYTPEWTETTHIGNGWLYLCWLVLSAIALYLK
jgi:hypothetical protein